MTTVKTETSATGEQQAPGNITLISHSMLLYWWPVWAVGLVLGCISLVDGYRMAILPEGTRLEARSPGGPPDTWTLTVPEGKAANLPQDADRPGGKFPVRVAANRNLGLIFCGVVLLVVFSTNIPLRGLWSVVTVLGLLIVVMVATYLGWWEVLVVGLGATHVYISAAGYLLVSVPLFVVWAFTVLVYDRNRYVTFSPGQLIVHQEVGDMQQVYDTTNVSIEKRRSDLFRHVLLGFFSGDVVIMMSGPQGQRLELANVLFAGAKVQQVADLMKTRPIVSVGS
jgi:hypothetical protein